MYENWMGNYGNENNKNKLVEKISPSVFFIATLPPIT